MAKPQLLQTLEHDKHLTKVNFPTFVETFNYTVNRLENIKGDYDINPKNGAIQFDTTDQEHPVIRLVNPTQASASASGFTGNIDTFTNATLTSSAVVFDVTRLVYSSGVLVSVLDSTTTPSTTPVTLDVVAYDNV